MEIGPIAGVRAMALLDRVKRDRRTAANLAVEPSTLVDDEAYGTGSPTSDCGLEEGASPEEREETESEPKDREPAIASRVDLFA